MYQDTVETIELNIKQAQEMVELGNALDRLVHSRDFIDVVKEGYLKKEAVRLVHLKADPNMQTPERQASIVQQIDAIGAFTGYLNIVGQRADMARKAIEEDEATLEELRNEGAA